LNWSVALAALAMIGLGITVAVTGLKDY